jgi:glyoxylase-like metal-dependent hydrolase (beta-lactamase superfamily II)
MARGLHRFALGEFECTAVRDGDFNYPLESFFAQAPPDEVEEVLRRKGMPTDHISTPYTCLHLHTGAHRVMIDAGAGALGAHAAAIFPSVDHSTTVTGLLLPNMRAAVIDPAEVDTVVITHAHPDHVGDIVARDGSLVFGNARYYVARVEWEFWMSDTAERMAPPVMVDIARRALEPLRERVTLVGDGDEIVPGIHVVAAPGHTPGHIALSIRSEDDLLLHIADTVLHPLHLEHPEWVPAFDMLPEQAAASKRRIFERAVREEALVFAHHFPPFPNLGWVSGTASGWNWQPVEESDPAPARGEDNGPRPRGEANGTPCP